MQRGKITILIILLVAVIAAVASVLYQIRGQQRAQDFWGTQTALLIDKAPQVEVLELGQPAAGLSLGENDEPDDEPPAAEGEPDNPLPVPTATAVEFDGTPWMIVHSKDAAGAKGITNLRRALVVDTTYDWGEPSTAEPHWTHGLAVEDGHDWATVLFDFESRQIGLAGGRRTALLNPEANSEFQGFFREQFTASEPDKEKPVEPPASEPADSAEQPRADSN